MSQAQQELQTFTIEELQLTVRHSTNKNDFAVGSGVLVVDFNALYATDYRGNWYLVGGDTTRKIIQYLHQNNVKICLISYGDQIAANAVLSLLKRDKISLRFQFILHSYTYDSKRTLLKTCKEAYFPAKEEIKNNTGHVGHLVYLGSQARDMKANKELGITGILSLCSSLNGSKKNESELFFGLRAVQQQFGLRKIKTVIPNSSSDDFTLEEVEETNPTWLSVAWKRFLNKLGDYNFDPKVPVFQEAKPVPATLSQWMLRNFFFPSWWKKWNYEGFKSALQTAFLVTYEFDGYDCTTGEISYADDIRPENQDRRYHGYYVSKSLLKAAFLGLPSRPTAYPATRSGEGAVPELTRNQLLSNFFGGFDWNESTPEAKKYFQIFGMPIKFPLIFVLNIVTWPFKLIRNIVKLFTEILPWLITIVLFSGLLRTLFAAHEFYQLIVHLYSIGKPNKEVLEDPLENAKYVLSKIGVFFFFIPMVIAGALSLAIYSVYFVFKVVLVVGGAATSPERSMRMAFANGKSLTISSLGTTVESIVRYVFGGVLSKLSISLSICLWALTFPLIFGAFTLLAPLVVMQKINWILQMPFVNASLIWLQGIFLVIKPYFVLVFGSTLSAVSTVIGYDITTLGILGIMSALVAITTTFIINNISNVWANWHESKVVVVKGMGDVQPSNESLEKITFTDSDFEEIEMPYQDQSDEKPGYFRRLRSLVNTTLSNIASKFVKGRLDAERRASAAENYAEGAYQRAAQGGKPNNATQPIHVEMDLDAIDGQDSLLNC